MASPGWNWIAPRWMRARLQSARPRGFSPTARRFACPKPLLRRRLSRSHAEASGARYRGEITQVRDTVRGGADATEVEVAKLNLRLLAPGEAEAGFVTLPIAHVEGLRADGSVAIPDGDLPPALTIAALPWYAGFLQEVVTGLDRIAEAHGALVLGGAGRSIENLLILELANTARPRFAHHLAQNLVHPCALYEDLVALAGRMATYG